MAETLSEADLSEDAGDGANDFTDEEVLAVINKMAAIDRQKADLARQRREVRGRLKSRGAKLGNLDAAYRYFMQDSPEAEEDLREQLRYMKILQVPTGITLDLFEHSEAATDSDRAYELGFRAGVTGAERQPGEEIHIEDHERWQEGYLDGQRKIAKGFSRLQADEDFEDPEEEEPVAPDGDHGADTAAEPEPATTH